MENQSEERNTAPVDQSLPDEVIENQSKQDAGKTVMESSVQESNKETSRDSCSKASNVPHTYLTMPDGGSFSSYFTFYVFQIRKNILMFLFALKYCIMPNRGLAAIDVSITCKNIW